MRHAELRKRIQATHDIVGREIAGFAKQGRIASGLAGEGYNGGYRDALQDVLLLLDDVIPHRNYWWPDVLPDPARPAQKQG